MKNNETLILGGCDVESILAGAEMETMQVVREAYLLHRSGQTSLPHSSFLQFPGESRNRIIALPAYVGGAVHSAGMKWIASFPGNPEKGFDRASAVLILNSAETGRAEAIMEASIISAKRTAASAALAARELDGGRSNCLGVVGCGPINFEIVRFLRAACPGINRLTLFDLDSDRARFFGELCREQLGLAEARSVRSMNDIFASATLVSFATTAAKPYLQALEKDNRRVLLHISLRDLCPELILSAHNVVDDSDHVCRAQTSLHLAEQKVGHRNFIRCTLADLLAEGASLPDDELPVVFSPFGLGILDIALGRHVYRKALQAKRGMVAPDFFPRPWVGQMQPSLT